MPSETDAPTHSWTAWVRWAIAARSNLSPSSPPTEWAALAPPSPATSDDQRH